MKFRISKSLAAAITLVGLSVVSLPGAAQKFLPQPKNAQGYTPPSIQDCNSIGVTARKEACDYDNRIYLECGKKATGEQDYRNCVGDKGRSGPYEKAKADLNVPCYSAYAPPSIQNFPKKCLQDRFNRKYCLSGASPMEIDACAKEITSAKYFTAKPNTLGYTAPQMPDCSKQGGYTRATCFKDQGGWVACSSTAKDRATFDTCLDDWKRNSPVYQQ